MQKERWQQEPERDITVWRSQEDSLALRILQTVDFCPSCNSEYNMILNGNEKKTVKAHIISVFSMNPFSFSFLKDNVKPLNDLHSAI